MTENFEFQPTAEDLQAIKDAIEVLNTKLVPLLVSLSPTERKELSKMGDKTFSFVTKSVEYMQTYPDLVPKYVDVEAAKKDLDATQILLPLHSQFTKLEEMVSDTSTLSGSEAYGASLSFYNSVKLQANEKVPGAEVIYEDLRTRFPGRGRKKTTPPTEKTAKE